MPPLMDLTGMRFGRLVVFGRDPSSGTKHVKWLCLCDCGEKASRAGEHLKNGKTKSCGCILKEQGWHKTTQAIRERRRRAEARAGAVIGAGKKRCTNPECPEENPQPLGCFGKGKGPGGFSPRCKTCRRWDHRKDTYGVAVTDLMSILVTQKHRCANVECGTALVGDRNTCIDHDHATGIVRGILCQACNVALGHLRDSPSVVRGLLAYAERHSQLRAV